MGLKDATVKLPKCFEELSEQMVSLDMSLRIHKQRSICLTFKKAQSFIQNYTKRDFTKKNLSQIAAVMPEAYSFKCVPCDDARKKYERQTHEDLWRFIIDGDLSRVRKEDATDS